MGVPLATTTITVSSRTVADDPYDSTPTPATVATGVAAHISSPSGRETVRGGSQEVIDKVLAADPVALTHTHRVTDDVTGDVYEVVWVDQRVGLGLDHTVAGLRRAGAAV